MIVDIVQTAALILLAAGLLNLASNVHHMRAVFAHHIQLLKDKVEAD